MADGQVPGVGGGANVGPGAVARSRRCRVGGACSRSLRVGDGSLHRRDFRSDFQGRLLGSLAQRGLAHGTAFGTRPHSRSNRNDRRVLSQSAGIFAHWRAVRHLGPLGSSRLAGIAPQTNGVDEQHTYRQGYVEPPIVQAMLSGGVEISYDSINPSPHDCCREHQNYCTKPHGSETKLQVWRPVVVHPRAPQAKITPVIQTRNRGTDTKNGTTAKADIGAIVPETPNIIVIREAAKNTNARFSTRFPLCLD